MWSGVREVDKHFRPVFTRLFVHECAELVAALALAEKDHSARVVLVYWSLLQLRPEKYEAGISYGGEYHVVPIVPQLVDDALSDLVRRLLADDRRAALMRQALVKASALAGVADGGQDVSD